MMKPSCRKWYLVEARYVNGIIIKGPLFHYDLSKKENVSLWSRRGSIVKRSWLTIMKLWSRCSYSYYNILQSGLEIIKLSSMSSILLLQNSPIRTFIGNSVLVGWEQCSGWLETVFWLAVLSRSIQIVLKSCMTTFRIYYFNIYPYV